MDAGISGTKGSTSKRRDHDAGPRRFRVVQALVMQGAIAAILLILAFLDRADRQSLLLYVVTLVIPAGWGYTFWNAWQREEGARREGRWSKEMASSERKRSMGMLGALLLGWVVLALVVVFVM